MVPTVDRVRYNFLVRSLVSGQYPVLLTGPVGTGKTSVAQSVLQDLDPAKWTMLTINMSSQVPAGSVYNSQGLAIHSHTHSSLTHILIIIGKSTMHLHL